MIIFVWHLNRSALGPLFAILLIIAILYPLANVISSLVQEKESKLREGLLQLLYS